MGSSYLKDLDLGHFIQVLERQVELLQLQGQAIAIIIIIYILEITMEKFKIFNKILIFITNYESLCLCPD